MIIAHVVLRLYKRSTTTKRTENKCSAIVACGWCVTQTLLLTRGPTPPPWRLSVLPTQRTLGSVRSTLSKNSSYSPFEIHICWRFTISQLKKLAVAKPRPSPGTETCSDLRTKTSEIEKQLAHHSHLTINLHCVNCGTSVSRFRVRICSETRSDGLRPSFKNRQLCSDRTVAGVSPQLHHVATFSDVSRFVA